MAACSDSWHSRQPRRGRIGTAEPNPRTDPGSEHRPDPGCGDSCARHSDTDPDTRSDARPNAHASAPSPPACSNGLDDDGDLLTDLDDPGCLDALDDSEGDP